MAVAGVGRTAFRAYSDSRPSMQPSINTILAPRMNQWPGSATTSALRQMNASMPTSTVAIAQARWHAELAYTTLPYQYRLATPCPLLHPTPLRPSGRPSSAPTLTHTQCLLSAQRAAQRHGGRRCRPPQGAPPNQAHLCLHARTLRLDRAPGDDRVHP
jgi:hypothetical protein